MTIKYDVILADPPWEYSRRAIANPATYKTRFGGGAYGHYPVMSTDDIAALPVPEVASEDAVLFLWATFPMLEDALCVIDAWDFTYKTIGFLWVKLNPGRARLGKRHLIDQLYGTGLEAFLDWLRFFGVGYYTKSNPEPCLLATRGDVLEPAVDTLSNVVFAPRGKHSAKPHVIHHKIEQLYPLDRYTHIELFAREPRPGWTVLGLGVDGQDMRVALDALTQASSDPPSRPSRSRSSPTRIHRW